MKRTGGGGAGEESALSGWEDHSISPWNMHAINKVRAPAIVSSQTHPSQRKLDLQGPPFWLCTDQPTRTEQSISSMLTLTALQSSNAIHDKLFFSPPTALGLFPVLFHCFFFCFFFLSPSLHALLLNRNALPQLGGDDWSVRGSNINVKKTAFIVKAVNVCGWRWAGAALLPSHVFAFKTQTSLRSSVFVSRVSVFIPDRRYCLSSSSSRNLPP